MLRYFLAQAILLVFFACAMRMMKVELLPAMKLDWLGETLVLLVFPVLFWAWLATYIGRIRKGLNTLPISSLLRRQGPR